MLIFKECFYKNYLQCLQLLMLLIPQLLTATENLHHCTPGKSINTWPLTRVVKVCGRRPFLSHTDEQHVRFVHVSVIVTNFKLNPLLQEAWSRNCHSPFALCNALPLFCVLLTAVLEDSPLITMTTSIPWTVNSYQFLEVSGHHAWQCNITVHV